MSYLRIVLVDADVEGEGATDAIIQTLREVLGRGSSVAAIERDGVAVEPPNSKAVGSLLDDVVPAKPATVIYEPPPPKAPPAAVAPPRKLAEPAKVPPRRTFAPSDKQPSIAAQILACFRENQQMPKPEMARRIYGNALPETLNKLQSSIYMLVAGKKLHRVGLGRYEVLS